MNERKFKGSNLPNINIEDQNFTISTPKRLKNIYN